MATSVYRSFKETEENKQRVDLEEVTSPESEIIAGP